MEQTYTVQKIQDQKAVKFRIVNVENAVIAVELMHSTQKKKRSRKWGCLLWIIGFILSIIFDNGEDMADSNNTIKKLRISNPQSEKGVVYKTVLGGVVVKNAAKKLGQLKVAKIEFLAKYNIKVGNKRLGKLIPDSIWHHNLKVMDGDTLMATFTKRKHADYVGIIKIYADLSQEEFQVLLGGLLLWYPILNA